MDEKKIKIGCVGLGPRGADLFNNRLCAVERTETVSCVKNVEMALLFRWICYGFTWN